jgi:WD40 repeat protein
VAFSPDGTRLVSGGYDSTVRLWDARTGAELVVWPTDRPYLVSVTFNPSGDRVFAGDGSSRGRVYVWDASARGAFTVLEDDEALADALAFSPDGRLLAAAAEEGALRIWDLAARTRRVVLDGGGGSVSSLAFDPAGGQLACGDDDGTVNVREPASGRILRRLEGHTLRVNSVAFSRDGAELVSASADGTVRVWDTRTGKALAERQFDEQASAVLFMPDGATIVVGSGDPNSLTTGLRRTLHLWHWKSGAITATADGMDRGAVIALALSPGGERVAVTGSGHMESRIWSAQLERQLATLAGHNRPVHDIAFTPDFTRIVTASSDGTVRLWDAETYEPLLVLRDPSAESVRRLAVSPDGSLIATVAGNRIHLWDSRSASPLEARELVSGLFEQLVFSTDVVERLRSDRSLGAQAREAAIRLAEWRGDNPRRLYEDSWNVVKAPGAVAAAYGLALRRAELAVRLAPWETGFVAALGAAHYRLGQYEPALAVLTADGARPSGGSARQKAFVAMAYCRLGQAQAAEPLLDDLRRPREADSTGMDSNMAALLRGAAGSTAMNSDLAALLREADATCTTPAGARSP